MPRLQHGNPGGLLRGHHPAGTNQPGYGGQNGDWVQKKHQDETAGCGIEGSVAHDLSHVHFGEAQVVQADLRRATLCARDRAGFTFDADHLACGTNEASHEHGNASHAGSQIEDTLAGLDAYLAEQPFCHWRDSCGLPDQSLLLGRGVAPKRTQT